MEQQEKLYTPNDLAQMGIMSLVMQWQERKSGRLSHYRIGRKVLYSQRHLDRYFAGCEKGGESGRERDGVQGLEK